LGQRTYQTNNKRNDNKNANQPPTPHTWTVPEQNREMLGTQQQGKKKKKRNVIDPSHLGFHAPPSTHDVTSGDDDE
jgi:hypothetical protein